MVFVEDKIAQLLIKSITCWQCIFHKKIQSLNKPLIFGTTPWTVKKDPSQVPTYTGQFNTDK